MLPGVVSPLEREEVLAHGTRAGTLRRFVTRVQSVRAVAGTSDCALKLLPSAFSWPPVGPSPVFLPTASMGVLAYEFFSKFYYQASEKMP
jgi:hypothetical protein